MKALFIAFVWPEPESSAAGVRALKIINALRSFGHEVRVTSPCRSNDHQEKLKGAGITTARLEPNDPTFDVYIKDYKPNVVIFDRFMIEEQFGWRVREHCPDAACILDTVDLHSLRRLRQSKVERREDPWSVSDSDLLTDDGIREVSSIYRSDLSLIISEPEMQFLRDRYNVPREMLSLCSFSYPPAALNIGFDDRKHFAAIGNFNHPPNVDSFRLLRSGLWKDIKDRLEDMGVEGAELHIYGAYPTREFTDADDEKSGFRVKGWAPDVVKLLSNYRVSLSPLRFGAGLKGKIADSWASGAPCVATAMAAEGMSSYLKFGGIVQDDLKEFAKDAARLYSDKSLWERAQRDGADILKEKFSEDKFIQELKNSIENLMSNLQERRAKNIFGAMLNHHQHRSLEFFSRWIEAKARVS